MSASVPYHLRTNKAIDRSVFFDFLSHFRFDHPIQDYKYFSLGGPTLEDHHALHKLFGLTKLFSIERDASVYSRQVFNKSYNCINCEEGDLGKFIDGFERDSSTVFWLDYTDTQWSKQLIEFSTLVSKLDSFDVVKLTINANPDAINGIDKEKLKGFRQKAGGKYFNENVLHTHISAMPKFAEVLVDMIQAAADDALLCCDDIDFFPVNVFRYIDNKHQMLSVTGIILPTDSDINEYFSDSHADVKDYISTSWRDIQEIGVPDLSPRERHEIEKLLPINEENIDKVIEELPFRLNKNQRKSKDIVIKYAKYYRHIPSFHKVIV
ncbi:MAG: hypothetical protein CMH97_00560 [Oceanospirillaceae bacterium]|nr:hypothetical protein [Oceanospirillaceae bacterium]